MSDEPNSDAVDILSELENDAKNTNNEPEEQVTSVPEESTNSESEKILENKNTIKENINNLEIEIKKENEIKIKTLNQINELQNILKNLLMSLNMLEEMKRFLM